MAYQFRWRQTSAVCVVLLGVLVAAGTQPSTAQPIEIIWTALGACGSVYAAQAWWRRWLVNQWRKREHFNGLFALTCEQHLVLRATGLLVQLLILAGGLCAMATPSSIRPELQVNDLVTTLTLLGIGALSTFSVWYAESKANEMAHYLLKHPEA